MHPVYLGRSIFAPLFELPPVTIPARSQRLTPSLFDAWQRTRFFLQALTLHGLRVTVFRIAALLVYASSVISYRYTLRFCLESIQARPRRRFFIHRAHNPKRLYIHRLGYPLIPAITCTVKDISRIKRRFLPAFHSSRRVSRAFTYCFSSGSRSSFKASTPRQGISKSGGHPRKMHRGSACN